MRIECHAISKTYGNRNGHVGALENVSFQVADQEFVAILGPSGCGKTTLLKIIAGLLAPSAGRIELHDAPPAGRPSSAMVFQDHGLFPWMTVLENVAFGLRMQGGERDASRQRARDFIARVGLQHFAGSYPHELSVGMRQRVGIVRAFVTDPPLLLMDEPFGALDSQTRRVLQGELLRLWGERRSIVVFVTHDIDEAIRLADRILLLSGRPGQVREEIPVPLSRPRDLESLDPARVSEIRRHIWHLMEAEVRTSLGMSP